MQVYVHGGDVYSARERLKGPILDFSANINPLGMPPAVQQAARAAIGESICYPDPFCRKLTAAIAEKEAVPQDWLICGNGAADLIFRLVWAVQPQRALLVAPGFAEYEQALKSVHCQIVYHHLQPETEFAVTEALLPLLTADLDMIFLCNPNNPTGQVIPPELLQSILRRCQENHILVTLDECFGDFLAEPAYYSMKSKLPHVPNLFLLKAFTKLYGMAGLRLGYGMTANAKLLTQMHQNSQPWSVSTPAQAAGIQALQEDDFVEQTRVLIQTERQYLKEGLLQLGWPVWGSWANYIFFRAQPDLAKTLEEEGILIRDCRNYLGLSPGYFRIAVRLHEENRQLLQAMERIKKKGL